MRFVGSTYPASVYDQDSGYRVMMCAWIACGPSHRMNSSSPTICNARSNGWFCCAGSPAASTPASSRPSIGDTMSGVTGTRKRAD